MALDSRDTELLQNTPLESAFSPAQIQHYLQHISFPLPLTHPRDTIFLQTLHRCQITSIPYENLSLHYNSARTNSIDPQDLYAKFLPDFHPTASEQSRGRGGFCFETSVFFLHILKGLGFRAYPTAARIRIRDHLTRVPAGPFVGPRHVVNLVLLEDGSVWSCDVGFGGDGPTTPLLLSSCPGQEPEAVANLGAQQIRLQRGAFPNTLKSEANQVWFYEYRNGTDAPWNQYYAFGEAEASAWDLECSNWWVASHPESFQRKQILVVKFIRGTAGEDGDCRSSRGNAANGEETATKHSTSTVQVIGKIMLADGIVKRNMGGRTEVVQVCTSEEERIKALKEHFGIVLSNEARKGIQGFETELTGDVDGIESHIEPQAS
ncbi:cysteine proteinase [Cryphonectria parasitica EP155]|uniref:Cysteine proteinase n=1 Tax=Cryphonectria parasitica (strain ATCC 38755 / EP155) TaxID=660469 RepID=A0A9P4Y334_CRYP1|nr:cysteine proteinase [Cryphonectria parasitica EP155]KAF3765778.1 cysteine proteinase [Cryphonectria parasitica EP155]